MSWNYDMSSYEAKRLLNLDEEPGFRQTTVVSEIKTTVVAETVWKTSNPISSQPPSVTISRANSDLSLYTPVIVKYRDSKTDTKIQLEHLLR